MSFLGLDVGGTSCRYEWWPEDELPGGSDAGVQPAVHGVAAATDALAATLRTATRTVTPDAALIAMAGAGDPEIAGAIVTGLAGSGISFPVAIAGDVLAAAAAALRDGPGVRLSAGTGSFAVARDRRGELHRVGGRGYLLGDQGSGYDFVRRAAAAVLMAVDGLGPKTALTASLTAAFGAPSPQRLGAVLQQLEPGAVARQLPVVVAAAAAGDAVAADVLEAGTEGLALLAGAAARSAGLEPRGLGVSLGGGVLQNVPAVTELLTRRLDALGFEGVTVLDGRAAARGAAWLAWGNHTGREPQRSWVRRVTL